MFPILPLLIALSTPADARVAVSLTVGIPGVVVHIDPFNPTWAPAHRAGWVWQSGYWAADGEWIPGQWIPTVTRAGSGWVPGYWAGSVWTDGYWRPQARPNSRWVDGYYRHGRYVSGYWAPHHASVKHSPSGAHGHASNSHAVRPGHQSASHGSHHGTNHGGNHGGSDHTPASGQGQSNGHQGNQGTAGNSGSQGNQGTAGNSGSQGGSNSGSQGNQGTAGNSGSQGGSNPGQGGSSGSQGSGADHQRPSDSGASTARAASQAARTTGGQQRGR